MSEERKRILQMLEEGKINVDEANDLLSTLEGENRVEKTKNSSKAKSIKILVEENGKEQVNISIPMVIAKSFMKFIPKSAKKSLDKENIDIEEILNSIDSDSNDGTLVDINDGKDHVVIKAE